MTSSCRKSSRLSPTKPCPSRSPPGRQQALIRQPPLHRTLRSRPWWPARQLNRLIAMAQGAQPGRGARSRRSSSTTHVRRSSWPPTWWMTGSRPSPRRSGTGSNPCDRPGRAKTRELRRCAWRCSITARSGTVSRITPLNEHSSEERSHSWDDTCPQVLRTRVDHTKAPKGKKHREHSPDDQAQAPDGQGKNQEDGGSRNRKSPG